MLLERRYQVFLSSTYDDLREARQAATQSILAMGHLAAGMELFPASDLTQLDLIKRVIAESDYYVVIIGGRYGSLHPETKISFTELEYDHALELAKPILGFVTRDVGKLASERVESNQESLFALERFRTKVLSKTCQYFDDSKDLGLKLMSSLVHEMRINPQVGWIRADQARNSEDIAEERELKKLAKEQADTIQVLERQVRDAVVPIPEIERDYAYGAETTKLTARFSGPAKEQMIREIQLSWDEIFSAVGPTMFGYIVRRARVGYGNQSDQYPFENNLCELVRTKIFDLVGQRTIYVFPHDVDRILIQYKQLGYIEMTESIEEDHKFRGFTLTPLGEHKLTARQVAVSGGMTPN